MAQLSRSLSISQVVLPSSLQLPFVAKVTTAWESIGGGYMSLQPNALLCITYIGDSNKPNEAGWCFGKMCGQEQSGWFPATTATKIIACKAVADWSTADGGYLTLDNRQPRQGLPKQYIEVRHAYSIYCFSAGPRTTLSSFLAPPILSLLFGLSQCSVASPPSRASAIQKTATNSSNAIRPQLHAIAVTSNTKFNIYALHHTRSPC